ncbi:unnamed protein product [Diamesa tonsa]
MNINYFREICDLTAHSGFRLTQRESALIENSLIILQSSNKLSHMFFWGRIETVENDYYYIAFGYTKDILKDRKFFYSLNGYEWLMLPECKPELRKVALKCCKKKFQGDPANVEEVLMDPVFVSDSEDIFVQCPPAIKKIKEEDRLSCIVHLITEESAIVPRGALYRQVNRSIAFNPCFKGLSRIDASSLKNYQLYRFPRNNRTFNLTKREDYNYQTDFFDTIDDLIPVNGNFTCCINDRDVCMIRSLRWLGMCFYHKINTIYQGFCYFGSGYENLDLLFTI